MDFNTAVKTCFAKYAGFDGRARRSEFWWFFLFGVIVSLVGGVIDEHILGIPEGKVEPIGTILWIVLFLPQWAVSVRRLHDLEWTGWWSAPYAAILIIFEGVQLAGRDPYDLTGTPLMWAPTVIFCILSIIFLFAFSNRGTVGPNRYGADPLPEPGPPPGFTAG